MDLLNAAHFLAVDNPDLAQEYGLDSFQSDSDLIPNFSDAVKITATLNKIIETPALRAAFLTQIATLIPDGSGYVDDDKMIRVLQEVDTSEGIFVDLCCGMGYTTTDWQERTGMNTVGVDKQYHKRWYEDWNNPDRKTAFTRADIRQGTVMPDNSARVVMLRNVVQHVTEESLAEILQEATRLVEPETGIIMVAPLENQWRDNNGRPGDGAWRFYKKTADGEIQRVSYHDLVPGAEY